MIRFNDLLALPRSAVFAIVDETNRKVLVTYSTSLMASLARLVDRINSGEFCRWVSDSKDLEFKILETEGCRNRLMVRVGFYMREYKTLGYELLAEHPPVEYRVKCIPRYITSKYGANGVFVLQAVLVSKRNSKIVVGEFKTQAEYDAFISLNYSNDSVYDIKYDESVSSK